MAPERDAVAPPSEVASAPVLDADQVPAAEAAAGTGIVQGILYDTQSQRVPRAALIMTLVEAEPLPAMRRLTVTTRARGDFAFKEVPAGKWEIGIAKATSYVKLADVTVSRDMITPGDLYLQGTRTIAGNLTREREGLGLRLTLRNIYNRQVVAQGLAATLTPEPIKDPPDPLPPSLCPGHFEFAALPPTRYVLEVFPDAELPPQLAANARPVEIEIDVTVEDETLPPRAFTWSDFGLDLELPPATAPHANG